MVKIEGDPISILLKGSKSIRNIPFSKINKIYSDIFPKILPADKENKPTRVPSIEFKTKNPETGTAHRLEIIPTGETSLKWKVKMGQEPS